MNKLELEEKKGEELGMLNYENVMQGHSEYIDGDMVIDYLNKCHAKEIHFVDVYLNGEFLERFDVYNSGLIQDFYFSWFMCETYTNMNVVKSNDGLKFIIQNGTVFEFKASNQYYMYRTEAINSIEKKISQWVADKAGLYIEKTVIDHIYECDEFKGTKSIITKMPISYDEIDKEYNKLIKILDKVYEYRICNIPFQIEIDEGKVFFEDESQELYTTYKLCRE